MKRAITSLFIAFLMFACVINASALVTRSNITVKDTAERVFAEITIANKTPVMEAEKLEHEHIYAFDLHKKNSANKPESEKYPEIEPGKITIGFPASGGGNRQQAIGKDYRLFFVDSDVLVPVNINKSSIDSVTFTAEKLGTYALYYDPKVYSIDFYMGIADYDEDSGAAESDLYISYTGLTAGEEIELPAIPIREGYVFGGWTESAGSGGWRAYSEERDSYSAGDCPQSFRASWINEKHYKPLEIKVTHSDIVKGEEDGKTVTVSFINSAGFRADLLDEEGDNSEEFVVIGTNEVTVSKAEYINSKTIRLTLSGNSTDVGTPDEYYIGIRNYYLVGSDDENRCDYGSIQTNEYGFMKKFFTSDNAIKLTVTQKTPNLDIDGDGNVTLADLNRFMYRISSGSTESASVPDLNNDSKTDSKDILMLITEILKNNN